jgi:hypothetical protein
MHIPTYNPEDPFVNQVLEVEKTRLELKSNPTQHDDDGAAGDVNGSGKCNGDSKGKKRNGKSGRKHVRKGQKNVAA